MNRSFFISVGPGQSVFAGEEFFYRMECRAADFRVFCYLCFRNQNRLTFMTKLQSRNYGLDLLRVLACYMVLQVHAGEFYYIADGGLVAAGGEPVWACWLNSLCRTAVPLFVMLSGFFLLPVRERTRDFFARRFVRVVVPFLVWCVLYAIYQFLTGRTDAAGALLGVCRDRTPLVRLHAAGTLPVRPGCLAVDRDGFAPRYGGLSRALGLHSVHPLCAPRFPGAARRMFLERHADALLLFGIPRLHGAGRLPAPLPRRAARMA